MKSKGFKIISFTIIFLVFTQFVTTKIIWAQTPIQLQLQKLTQAKEKPKDELEQTDIQKAIDILEDDNKRQELIKLLKTLAKAQNSELQDQNASKQDESSLIDKKILTPSLKNFTGKVSENLSQLWDNTKLSYKYFMAIMNEAFSPQYFSTWIGAIRNILIFALSCLIFSWILQRKYGKQPVLKKGAWPRFWGAFKYILITTLPSWILIEGFALVPKLSEMNKYESWLLAKNLDLIQDTIQIFFSSLSLLYVVRRLADAIFAQNEDGKLIFNLNPKVAKHLKASWNIISLYAAFYLIFKYTVIKHIAISSSSSSTMLPYVLLSTLFLVFPIIITIRLLKLRKLISLLHLTDEEDTEESNKQPEPWNEKKHIYFLDEVVKKHWAGFFIFYSWAITIVSIYNLQNNGKNFWELFSTSFAFLIAGTLTISLERYIAQNYVSTDNDHGHKVLSVIDTFTNIFVWPVLLAILLNFWGVPVSEIFENQVILNLSGRFLAIVIIITVVALIVKFSRVVANWILASPDLSQNRMWRTMTPLVQTTIKALSIFIGIVVILERLGVNIGPILAGAGILGLGVGMGAQSLIKDLINGVSILLMDSIAVGDYVTIGSVTGTVEALGLRTIRLRDIKGNQAIVPNSSVDTIINMTKDFSQEIIDVTVPYDADPDKIITILKNVAKNMENDEVWGILMTSPVEVMGVQVLGSDGTTIRVRLNTPAGVQWPVAREMRLRIKRAMLKAGFKAPYQQIILHTEDDIQNYGKQKENDDAKAAKDKDSKN